VRNGFISLVALVWVPRSHNHTDITQAIASCRISLKYLPLSQIAFNSSPAVEKNSIYLEKYDNITKSWLLTRH